ncbi:pilus assembly FimT family protein [Parvibium lacunae]|uniref:Type II secretion system protein H n=1 Tax=Parvibium lacunae TaxID=1888893 RepID=A0A368L1D8_9BURK|nr:GspH/FimT family pseudopilin [Parvibium lacunae]RCS57386.1 prepilin-type N-terminal cleavage/methylation domain-containing protein [Parvibium lacunae]
MAKFLCSFRSTESRSSCGSGFTTVELLIVVAIIGLIAVFAAPALTDYVHNRLIRAAGEETLMALRLARSEAIKRRDRVTLTFTAGSPVTAVVNGNVACALNVVCNTLPYNITYDRRLTVATTNDRNLLTPAALANGLTAMGATTLSFDGLGRLWPNFDATLPGPASAIRIDIWMQGSPALNRVVLLISPNGSTRLCLPRASAVAFAC